MSSYWLAYESFTCLLSIVLVAYYYYVLKCYHSLDRRYVGTWQCQVIARVSSGDSGGGASLVYVTAM